MTGRPKQPEQVRRALLDAAAAIAVDRCFAAVTVQAVAAAAGVTKGGLFHHFANKQALIEGMFADRLDQFDAEIDAAMAADPGGRGHFTRAYLRAAFDGAAIGFHTPWSALTAATIGDAALCRLWAQWLRARIERHAATDDEPMLEIVRLAADGAWLASQAGDGHPALPALRDRLLMLAAADRRA